MSVNVSDRSISNLATLTIVHFIAFERSLIEVEFVMEDRGITIDLNPCASRMASRRKGGQVVLTGYFIAANIGLVATNAWGLSPLAAILIVWLGGGVISVCVAVAMASASVSDFTAMVRWRWQNEFGAEFQRR